MSVENFDGDGLADQPSIIYGYTDDQGELHIKELSRSGYGEPGPSPGDVIERESTKSTLDTRLPELNLPGEDGLARDDCGEDLPAFACASDDGCGKTIYVGRSCASPACERDWPAAVKDKVTRSAGKLEGLRRALYARHDGRKDIDFNHVVASMPDFLVDSDEPLERALLVLKTLLEEHWDIDGFIAIYHPYRIKREFRKDQYEHGGAPGEGDMVWSDILGSDVDDPYQYLTFEPHFHLFFPAIRKSFDYLTAEHVQEQSGWMFHRITKGEESNVSVEDLDDLVHQLTYSFSHCPVRSLPTRDELTSRMKGDLHNCYVPDGVEDKILASFCDAAPRLLGTRFVNLNEATCDAEVSADGDTDYSTESDDVETPEDYDCDEHTCVEHDDQDESKSHPLVDEWNIDAGPSTSTTGHGDPFASGALNAGTGTDGEEGGDDLWQSGNSSSTTLSAQTPSTETAVAQADDDESSDGESPVADNRETCGGELKPMREARHRLDDAEWCKQAEYVSGFRDAVEEWERLTGGDEDLPWTQDDGDDDDEVDASGVVQPD